MASTPVNDRPDGIAVVSIDLRKATSSGALAALRTGLNSVLSRLSDGERELTGTVLRIAGDADIPVIDPTSVVAGTPAERLTAPARELTDLLTRIETARAPVVTILEGQVLGAGFEAALACHHRIMLASPDARVGLTTLSLGMLPAAGSIGRLLRRMPARAAIDFLAKAEPADAPRAEELGLIDERAGTADVAEAMAVAWLKDRIQHTGADQASSTGVDPAEAQAAAALAMAALPGRRRAAIALAAVVSAWSAQERKAAAETELRRATDLATHADTRDWLERQQGSGEAEGQPAHPAKGGDRAKASRDANQLAARIRAAGLLEAMALVGDGIPATRVEQLAASIGLKPTPLAVLDEVSLGPIDAAHHATEHAHHEHAHHEHAHHEHAPHEHGHGHGHGHGHHHDHGHAHDHHGHAHGHEHGHAHGDGHDHEHQHTHGHAHAHPHAHEHEEQPAPYGLDESAWPEVPPSAVYVLEKMAHGLGRTGRSGKGGFYDYPAGAQPVLWMGLDTFERPSVAIDDADCIDRLVFVQAVEGLRCLADGLVVRERLDEILATAGFPLAGGLTALVDSRGRDGFEARCDELASRYGGRFALPERALDMFSTTA